MDLRKIGVRYAKAILELASEKQKLDIIYKDFINIEQIIFDKTSPLYKILTNSIIKSSFKKNLIENIFKNNVDELTIRFLLLIIEKGREQQLESIFLNFYKLYDEHNKIKKVVIRSVIKPDEEIINKIKNIIEKFVDKEYTIKIIEQTDETLIGGVVVEVDDYQFDASIRNKLNKIKIGLLNTSYKIKL